MDEIGVLLFAPKQTLQTHDRLKQTLQTPQLVDLLTRRLVDFFSSKFLFFENFV